MINSRMKSYTLKRIPDQLDAYGQKSSAAATVATIEVAISLNNQATEHSIPMYLDCTFIGLTTYKDVAIGDLITSGSDEYRVEMCGDKNRKYLILWLK